MKESEKKSSTGDKVFLLLTVIYVAVCAAIWIVSESAKNSSYVAPIPFEMPVSEEISDVPEDRKININTATEEELMTVKGIGEVTARNIVEYREENGRFNDIGELDEVSGIGSKTLEKIRPYLKV